MKDDACSIPLSLVAGAVLLSIATGCSQGRTEASPLPTQSPSPSHFSIDEVPAEARVSDGGGLPRPPAYWAVWNSCAEENRAQEAAENGGAEAGYVLVDDVLASPGLQLGEHTLETCDDALTVLEVTPDGQPEGVQGLAAELLAADLNRNVGAESCPAADEAAIGSHAILAALGYQGDRQRIDVEPERESAIPAFLELLVAYNAGELCV